MVQNTSDNKFGVAKWIVDADASLGTHTTIASAIASASSGDTIFVRPGTYTENFTLKAGVNLAAFIGDEITPNVTIVGTITHNTAGTCAISGIRLQTNGATNFLVLSGANASIVYLQDCYLLCSANTGISASCSSASGLIWIKRCQGDVTDAGSAYFDCTGAFAGFLVIEFSDLRTSVSTVANTIAAGSLTINNSTMLMPIATSGTAFFQTTSSNYYSNNTTNLTCAGSDTHRASQCRFNSGNAACIVVTDNLTLESSVVVSSHVAAISGAGTITYSDITFETGSDITVTTQVECQTFDGVSRSKLQPAFLARQNATVADVTGNGTAYTLGTTNLTEIYDQNSDFNVNGTFTAPVTGKYRLTANIYMTGATINTGYRINLVTSNRTYSNTVRRPATNQDDSPSITALCDMDAADTCTVTVIGFGEGADTDDILGDASVLYTYFCGKLEC